MLGLETNSEKLRRMLGPPMAVAVSGRFIRSIYAVPIDGRPVALDRRDGLEETHWVEEEHRLPKVHILLVPSSLLVTSSKALVTRSDALVSSSL